MSCGTRLGLDAERLSCRILITVGKLGKSSVGFLSYPDSISLEFLPDIFLSFLVDIYGLVSRI